MKLKSIVNSDIVNLLNCDSEPIHIPGSIQPHGFLLALTAAYEIKFCSANVSSINLKPEDILNKKIDAVLIPKECVRLIQYLEQAVFESSKPHTCRISEKNYSVNVHTSKEYLILEFESTPEDAIGVSDLYLQTQKFTHILSQSMSLKELCQGISEEIRSITGYDRVMVYKFDEQYNGEVFAEAKSEELEPFYGLHYPHTDIPAQARELYIRNLMRMIVSVDYQPIPIVTLDQEAAHHSLDLSHSILRSVSPIHVAYLKNMGVSGTLTISLLSEGKFWGLIACHHYAPKNVPRDVRIAAKLQGDFLTSQLRVQTAAEEYRQKLQLDQKLKKFFQILEDKNLSIDSELAGKELYEVTNSNGVCIVEQSKVQSAGDVPDNEEIFSLIQRLAAEKIEFISSSNIHHDFNLNFSNQIAGFMYYKLDAHTHVIWFRNELKKEIHWAGDPDKSIVKDANGLSPRKSFSVWKEVVANQTSDWLSTEKHTADECIYAIQKHYSYTRSIRIQEIQARLLKKLQTANEELENIHWISTHDLKEPIRKICVFASMLLDLETVKLQQDAVYYINRMSTAAQRMQRLLDDLMAFSKVRDSSYSFERTDLNEVVKAVLKENQDALLSKNISVYADTLPELYCIPFLMHQLFSNLISNSIKYSRPGAQPEIRIKSRKLEGSVELYEFIVSDNGKGFDNAYAELIFKLFQRLDKTHDIEGTGIGLAICQKITDIHQGKIFGTGTPNTGAEFRIILPYNPEDLKDEL